MTVGHSAEPNVNTRSYWDHRFISGDWENKGGRGQTEDFARDVASRLQLSRHFEGTILDFGCGLGDAIPIYRSWFPRAKLIGMDLSENAVTLARQRYGDIAEFIQGDFTSAPTVDVIVTSAVFEHLSDDRTVARHLLGKCQDLYIVVPYRERIIPGREHVNSYTEDYFNDLGCCDWSVFVSRGWSQYGYALWVNIYLKNCLRPLLGKRIIRRAKMIMFHLCNER